MKAGWIDINLCYKDRPTEMSVLLQSLLTQTYTEFDIYILDDGSNPVNQLENIHAIKALIQRLKLKGHRVSVFRNGQSGGVSKARQFLVDFCKEHGRGEFLCRIDDDVSCEPDYLEKLMEVIKAGYDLASGVTPPIHGALIPRETTFVKPIIDRIVLDKDGQFAFNGDDCGNAYLTEEIIPCHHFRSSALYYKSIHDKIQYEDTLTPCGFREEEFLSIKILLAGKKMGVHTGAIAWHLQAPGGGDRRQEYAQMATYNQVLLNRFVKRLFREHGDFIKKYNQQILKLEETPEQELVNVEKNSNLIFSREI